jgi:hypothetical protein
MSNVELFLTKAQQLYEVAPDLFKWLGGSIVVVLGAVGSGIWALRGHFAKSEIDGLKAQIGLHDQRVQLAKDQSETAQRETLSLKEQVLALQQQIGSGAKAPELTNATIELGVTVGRALAANELASGTLTGNVFIEARPKNRPEGSEIEDYIVQDHAAHVLASFKTQQQAINWSRRQGYTALVPRVRHLNDRNKPDHWRSAGRDDL